jgi:uncharacterized protein (DUF1778 family)
MARNSLTPAVSNNSFDELQAGADCQYIVSTTFKGHSKACSPVAARTNLRVRPQIKATLVQAARLQQVKLTEFMINSSQAAAEMALADRTRFVLPAGKWREFNAALDSRPREIPALRKLFGENSALGPA